MNNEYCAYCDKLCYDCDKFTWCELSPENIQKIDYIDIEKIKRKNMKDIKETPFTKNLMRTFSQLKQSRAITVAEDVEIIYKRKIEDLSHKIRSMDRDREDIMNSLAPSNAFSNNVVPSDFNAESFLTKDIQIGLNRRAAIIELEITVDRYNALFGEYPDMETVKSMIESKNTLNRSEIINESSEGKDLLKELEK